MTDAVERSAPVHRWYSRPVLFVNDLNRAVRFYVDGLGFKKDWHADDGKGTVCQVSRGDCEIILCQDAKRRDKARLFVELTADGRTSLVCRPMGRFTRRRARPVRGRSRWC
jgi:catechol 2,3-dioxygenase-like lactoylglutathione lyase family enzyme